MSPTTIHITYCSTIKTITNSENSILLEIIPTIKNALEKAQYDFNHKQVVLNVYNKELNENNVQLYMSTLYNLLLDEGILKRGSDSIIIHYNENRHCTTKRCEYMDLDHICLLFCVCCGWICWSMGYCIEKCVKTPYISIYIDVYDSNATGKPKN